MNALNTIRPMAITAMEELAARHGLNVKITNEKVEGAKAGFWFSFELADQDEKDEVSRQEFAAKCYCRATKFEVKPDDYGTIMVVKGLRYKLVGVNPYADKYPLNTEALDGGPSYRLPMQYFRVAKGTASEVEKAVYA